MGVSFLPRLWVPVLVLPLLLPSMRDGVHVDPSEVACVNPAHAPWLL